MPRPIALSLRSRGLVLYNQSKILDLRYQVVEFFKQCFDIGVAILVNIVLLSWSCWISIVISTLSTVFFTLYQRGIITNTGSLLLPFAFLVYLPILWMVHQAYNRREAAAQQLAVVKAKFCGIYMLHSSFLSNVDDVKLDTSVPSSLLMLLGM